MGSAKSGTHALAAMGRGRAAHEHDSRPLLRLVLAHESGRLEGAAFEQMLGQMLRRRQFDLDVSQINGFAIKALVRCFPEARYILTIRDSAGWLRSFVNHQLTIPAAQGSEWQAFRDLRFAAPPSPFTREDEVLERFALYPVDAYLGYWLRHNRQVLAAVPPKQLLVVATADLSSSAERIAEFLGWPAPAPPPTEPVFAGRYADSPLDGIDGRWLADKAEAYTAELLAAAGARFDSGIIAALTRRR
ncbi:MAG TPA: sulfotransferase [Allosphingosinicella sp.]